MKDGNAASLAPLGAASQTRRPAGAGWADRAPPPESMRRKPGLRGILFAGVDPDR